MQLEYLRSCFAGKLENTVKLGKCTILTALALKEELMANSSEVKLKQSWVTSVVRFMSSFTGVGYLVPRSALVSYTLTTPLSDPEARYCPLGEAASEDPLTHPWS